MRIAGGTGGQSPSDRSPNAAEEIARRKGEHLSLAAEADVETRTAAGWDDIHLVHDALPDIDASDVDLGTTFLGHRLKLPLVISGMTGGHGRALAVNELLARVAERSGIAIGVGSQRAALRDPMLVPTYSIVRETAPHAFVIANLGISQLVKQDRESPLGARDGVVVGHARNSSAVGMRDAGRNGAAERRPGTRTPERGRQAAPSRQRPAAGRAGKAHEV